jgi:hypothetical protein
MAVSSLEVESDRFLYDGNMDGKDRVSLFGMRHQTFAAVC